MKSESALALRLVSLGKGSRALVALHGGRLREIRIGSMPE